MSSESAVYFSTQALRDRFVADLDDALEQSRISTRQHQWLGQWADPEQTAQSVVPGPRVDRIVLEQAFPSAAEPATALLLSDPASSDATVFLHTLLDGLTSFASREQLLRALNSRFSPTNVNPPQWEYERLEGDPFELRMHSVIAQYGQSLAAFAEQLLRLPSLQTVLGHALQDAIDRALPLNGVNVFSHLLQQVRHPDPGEVNSGPVVLTIKSLAQAAMDSYVQEPLSPGIYWRFLDAQGHELPEPEANIYLDALAGIHGVVEPIYEGLLDAYWSQATNLFTRRDLGIALLADTFGHHLLGDLQALRLSKQEFIHLRSLLPGAELASSAAQPLTVSLSVSVGDQQPVKLTGVFLIDLATAGLTGLLMYCVKQGLRRFANRQEVAEYFMSAQGQTLMLHGSSLNDHELLAASGTLRLRLDDIERPLFEHQMDSIIALQKRNVAYALKRRCSQASKAAVIIDDALDIRGLLNQGLFQLGTYGRWRDESSDFEQLWPSAVDSRHRLPESAIDQGAQESSPTWMQYLNLIQEQILRVNDLRPTVAACGRKVLNQYLTIFSESPLDARALWVKPPDAGAINVLILFMERMTGHVRTPLPTGCNVFVAHSEGAQQFPVAGMTIGMLEQVFELAGADFRQALIAQTRRFCDGQFRRLDTQVLPGQLSVWIRANLLHVVLRISHRLGNVQAASLAMLKQVLSRPTMSLRTQYGDATTEVHELQVVYQADRPAAPMTDVFVLQQPMDPAGHLVLWSPTGGLKEFATPAALEAYINARLADPDSRTQWLSFFRAPERERLDVRLRQSLRVKVNLERIDEHFVEHLQKLELERQVSDIVKAWDEARQWQLDPSLTDKLLCAVGNSDNIQLMLDSLTFSLEAVLFRAFAPQWINEADPKDLFTLNALLVRANRMQGSDQSFMFDIPSLEQYSRDQLLKRLNKDFPGAGLDPDRILISLTRYVGAPPALGQIPSSLPAATNVTTETLTQFAIDRFAGVQDALLSVADKDEHADAQLPSPSYIRDLVRDLDIGATFQVLLAQKLDAQSPDHARRVRLFATQMPPLLILAAFELRMQKLLSDKALNFIGSVLDMPDGLARLPVGGERVVLSPFQLVAEAGRSADRVTGCYLITPHDTTKGPWILYVLLVKEVAFLEYENEAALLADLRSSTGFQAIILERLDPQAQRIYGNGGFTEPHLPWSTESFSDVPLFAPAPPRVLIEPVQGNTLRYLFDDMKTLLRLAIAQASLTTAQFNSQAYRFLMGLGTEQTLLLLPGRIGLLVNAWQSKSLLSASANALHDHQWGKAFSEISAAVGVLISSRQEPGERSEEVSPSGAEYDYSALPREFSWDNGPLTPEQQGRLQQMEVSDVSLNELAKDNLYNVYRDTRTQEQYAAVQGKVYQVRITPEGWRIVDGEVLGPYVRLNKDQQWVLEIRGGLRGGGGAITRLRSSSIDDSLDQIFIAEASGITAIRQQYPDKARRIAEAHLHARNFLHTARSNLQPEPATGALAPGARQIVVDFFGVRTPDERLLGMIKQTVDQLYDALLDPSLSPFYSERFVVGTNRLGYQDSTAFTFSADPHKRIFLTERFFRGQTYRIKPPPSGENGFNVNAHFRTTVLLHELTHVANHSHDIAYVESSAPFLDLLLDSGEYYAGLKLKYERLQKRCLSHLTPRDELFKDTTSDDMPRDLQTSDGDAKLTILRITGKKTLEEARDVFFDDAEKRSEIILSNADSITLLVTLLGRERFTPPSP